MTCTYHRKRIPDLPGQATRALDDEFYAIEQVISCLQEGTDGLGVDLSVTNITDSSVTVACNRGDDAILPAATATTAGVATAAQATLIGTAVQPPRSILTNNGIQGGGNLSADRTLSPVYGYAVNTVCEGNDSRLSNARTPTVHAATHATAGTDPITPAAIGAAAATHAATHATAGTDPITPAAIGAAAATHAHTEADVTDLDRLRFRGMWNATASYVKNDTVIDGPYIAVAKAATTDKPAPVFTQANPGWVLSNDAGIWTETPGPRWFGHRYGPMLGDTLAQGVRFRTVTAGLIQYAHLVVNGTASFDVAKNLVTPENAWVEVRFPPFLLRLNDVVDLVVYVDGTHNYASGPNEWSQIGIIKSFSYATPSYPPTSFSFTQFGADVLIQAGTMSTNWAILCKSAT